MADTFSKIESFLFDILGLVLPGIIFLAIFILPVSLVDLTKIPPNKIDMSFILSELSSISKILDSFWNAKSSVLIISLIILAYLIGHFIKVFAIIKYEILTAIFDKTLNKCISWLFEKTKSLLNVGYTKLFKTTIYSNMIYKWLKELFYPIKNILSKIFVFKPSDYFSDNHTLRTNCVNVINERINANYPDSWYSVYKFSTIITNQEGIKSLAGNFLAKYNLYRSLAFIFIFATIYYSVFLSAAADYIEQDLKKIGSLILLTTTLLWFTFHYKYKRYWKLCGNETLVSLFYFLNKKKINET